MASTPPGAGADLVIAHVVPAGVHPCSGLLVALSQLAIAQAQRGHKVEVWLLGPVKPGANEQLYSELRAAGIEPVAFSLSRAPGRLSAEAARRVAARRVEIVHLHGVFSPHNNDVARRLRVPYVVSPHGGYAPEALEYHALRKRVFAWVLERPMLRRARVVCALTTAEASEVRRFGVTGPVAVVPNGVPDPAGRLDRGTARAMLGVPPEARVAVYVGRLDVRAKRLEVVVRGIAATSDWHLHIVGGDFRNGARDLAALVREARLGHRVRITGPRRGRALRAELACADLFVLLSRSEGMPMALLEAASLGIPSLVSPEVDRATGVAAAGGAWVTDVTRIDATLARLARVEPREWASRSRAASQYARDHDWSSIAAAYDRVYAGALGTKQRTSDPLTTGAEIAVPG